MHTFRVVAILLLAASCTKAARLPVGYLINDKTTDTGVVAGGDVASGSHELAVELESELKETARNQMTLSIGLEQAAAYAAREARLLQKEADLAKLRAFDAVAQEHAIVNAERSLEAEREQLKADMAPQFVVRGYLDPLMETSETVKQKRINHFYQPDTIRFSDADNTDLLEALRIRYLQNLLANRQNSIDVPELLEPANRVILDKPETERQEQMRLINRNPGMENLFENELAHDRTRQPIPEHLLTSTIDDFVE